MSLFNKTSKTQNKTVNRAGGEAYKQNPEMQLVSLLLTSFAQDQYYRSANETFKELTKLLTKVDAKFAAQAAIYARTEFGMRSITHVLAAELAPYLSGQEWAKDFYQKIVYRPDDMLEIASYFKSIGGKNMPNAMKKGFAKAFDRFDGYQIAKYRGEGKAINLIDIVNLVHPTPTKKNATALQQLVEGTLRNTQTWETMLTQAGQNAKSEAEKAKLKAKVWEDLLREGKLGYFALLRNLRNIIEQAPKMIKLVCKQLKDVDRIKGSLVLPFRLLTAYKQLKGNGYKLRKVRQALERAIDLSCANVPDLYDTLVVIDNSGSMHSPVAKSPYLLCNEMGAFFGMILAKSCNADIMEFGNHARYISYNLNDSALGFAANFERNNRVGHGTNFHSIFQTAAHAYKRIVIFSDMQGWIGYTSPSSAFKAYKERKRCNPYVYSFDLRGYGSLQFPENKVYALAGFSDKVFDLMRVMESEPKALVHAIRAIEL